MSEVKWIKINVDMFDDEKIKIIQSMPEGDALLIVWIKLITLAGKTNDGGYVYISEDFPYTDEMLAVIMNKPINTIRLALNTFTKLNMIENDTKGIYLVNFEKHQSLDKLAQIREKTRKRVEKYREKQKLLTENKTSNVTNRYIVTPCNAIDIDIDIEKDIDINNNIVISNQDNENSKVKLEEEFEVVWKEYPRKQGKTNAYKSFIKARKKGVNLEDIINGIQNYKKYIEIKKVEPQYIKQGSTWFNQECWNDEYNLNIISNAKKERDGSEYAMYD